ncbi:hypothetical protein C2E20_2460 [Micractinium conductrix]|uniref:Uncharacterized protein n=1 Tax=Micractinium conductrix TaxID=554055 RepID=A0A2P6VL61_9CHLO|nr:hypothetical protein C2E20_2460 [Micractinium conductrix]|eukprot:PSC74800.1 hypothetical protein C2E20_2460 [Micractinium conductrix]
MFIRHPLTAAILALPEARLEGLLANDAYKPRMHRLYARYMPGVQADFELWVRRTPLPLACIRKEDPWLWQRFEAACARRLGVPPYPPAVVAALEAHFAGFAPCPEDVLARAAWHGVAPVSWQEIGGELLAFAQGPIEAASHVETTLTQLVQELTIAAQVRALERTGGQRITPTELLANALGKLAAGVERLQAEAAAQAAGAAGGDGDGGGEAGPDGQPQRRRAQGLPAMLLFASRRSSSRRYLVLQNWYCMQHMPHFGGTSAVLAVTLLRQLLLEQPALLLQAQQAAGTACAAQRAAQAGVPAPRQAATEAAGAAQQAAEPPAPDLRLVGTLAHEVMMVTDQLLGRFDDLDPASWQVAAGSGCGGSAGGGGLRGGGGGGGGGGPAASTHGSDSGGRAASRGPAQICSLVAHLLLLAAGGGVHRATALCDTFGTCGFVSAALAAELPAEFQQDVQEGYPGEWAALPAAARAPGARVFDIFTWWRMDSGSYEEMADYVMSAWEQRWADAPPCVRPPRPRLMHSNLESFDEILQMWRLPARIRPAAFAFGTLADGFVPFDCEAAAADGGGGSGGIDGDAQATHGGAACSDGGSGAAGGGAPPGSGSAAGGGTAGCGSAVQAEVKLCSVVMKAVQASRPGAALPRSTESAGKLGDDVSASKAQFDRRLPPEAVDRTRRLLLLLSCERHDLDPAAASAALAAVYHAVTRQGVLR